MEELELQLGDLDKFLPKGEVSATPSDDPLFGELGNVAQYATIERERARTFADIGAPDISDAQAQELEEFIQSNAGARIGLDNIPLFGEGVAVKEDLSEARDALAVSLGKASAEQQFRHVRRQLDQYRPQSSVAKIGEIMADSGTIMVELGAAAATGGTAGGAVASKLARGVGARAATAYALRVGGRAAATIGTAVGAREFVPRIVGAPGGQATLNALKRALPEVMRELTPEQAEIFVEYTDREFAEGILPLVFEKNPLWKGAAEDAVATAVEMGGGAVLGKLPPFTVLRAAQMKLFQRAARGGKGPLQIAKRLEEGAFLSDGVSELGEEILQGGIVEGVFGEGSLGERLTSGIPRSWEEYAAIFAMSGMGPAASAVFERALSLNRRVLETDGGRILDTSELTNEDIGAPVRVAGKLDAKLVGYRDDPDGIEGGSVVEVEYPDGQREELRPSLVRGLPLDELEALQETGEGSEALTPTDSSTGGEPTSAEGETAARLGDPSTSEEAALEAARSAAAAKFSEDVSSTTGEDARFEPAAPRNYRERLALDFWERRGLTPVGVLPSEGSEESRAAGQMIDADTGTIVVRLDSANVEAIADHEATHVAQERLGPEWKARLDADLRAIPGGEELLERANQWARENGILGDEFDDDADLEIDETQARLAEELSPIIRYADSEQGAADIERILSEAERLGADRSIIRRILDALKDFIASRLAGAQGTELDAARRRVARVFGQQATETQLRMAVRLLDAFDALRDTELASPIEAAQQQAQDARLEALDAERLEASREAREEFRAGDSRRRREQRSRAARSESARRPLRSAPEPRSLAELLGPPPREATTAQPFEGTAEGPIRPGDRVRVAPFGMVGRVIETTGSGENVRHRVRLDRPGGPDAGSASENRAERADREVLVDDSQVEFGARPQVDPTSKTAQRIEQAAAERASGARPRFAGLRANGTAKHRHGKRPAGVMSSSLPKGVRKAFDPLEEHLVVGMEAVRADKSGKRLKAIANYLRKTPLVRNADADDAKVIAEAMRTAVKNLLFLHDSYRDEVRVRARRWYDGALKLSQEWSERFGVSVEQVAATMACLSPQKEWFQNLSAAERVLTIVGEQRDTMFSPEQRAWGETMRPARKKNGRTIPAQPQLKPDELAQLEGKTLGELIDAGELRLAAMFVRSYDHAFGSSDYHIYSPEGNRLGLALTEEGKPKKMAWGNYGEIAKAISSVVDGSDANISNAIGDAHKVRSFYNNIRFPQGDWGDVTSDTHAVAAAMLLPLSGKAPEVAATLSGGDGAGTSATYGVVGLYPFFADAYRIAAKQRGILPREMQSITWEAGRGLFTPDYKQNSDNVDAIRAIWERYRSKKLSLKKTQDAIVEAAGGVLDPPWFVGPDSQLEGRDDGGAVPSGVSVAGGDGGAVGRRGDGVDGGAGAVDPDGGSGDIDGAPGVPAERVERPRLATAPQTDTPEFKEFFGSSVVSTSNPRIFEDEAAAEGQGEPLELYHGRSRLRDEDADMPIEEIQDGGFWMFDSIDAAEEYAGGKKYVSVGAAPMFGQILPVYARIERPMYVNLNGQHVHTARKSAMKRFRDAAGKYDGIIFLDGEDALDPIGEPRYTNVYWTPDGAQVKSSTGNQGTFSRASRNPRFARRQIEAVPGTDTAAFSKFYDSSAVGYTESGQPKALFHGTLGRFTRPRMQKGTTVEDLGFWMSEKVGLADAVMRWQSGRLTKTRFDPQKPTDIDYAAGANAMMVYAAIEKPFVVEKRQELEAALAQELEPKNEKRRNELAKAMRYKRLDAEDAVRRLKEKGYDGIHLKDDLGFGPAWIAFDMNQVKSATGNRGSFDRRRNDFRFATAPQDDLGFYSASLQAALDSPQKSYRKNQVRARLLQYGANKEELEWMNLDLFLDSFDDNEKISAEQLEDHLRAHQVELVETVREGGPEPDQTDIDVQRMDALRAYRAREKTKYTIEQEQDRGGKPYFTVVGPQGVPFEDFLPATQELVPTEYPSYEEANSAINQYLRDEAQGMSTEELFIALGRNTDYLLTTGGTRHDVMVEHGKHEDYREVLIRMPNNPRADRQFVQPLHFPEENVLLFARTTTRYGPNGEKIFFVEEMQSDWHSEARKGGGYDSPSLPPIPEDAGVPEGYEIVPVSPTVREKPILEIDPNGEPSMKRLLEYRDASGEILAQEVVADNAATLSLIALDESGSLDAKEHLQKFVIRGPKGTRGPFAYERDAAAVSRKLERQRRRLLPPDAPYRKSYYRLGMHRMIRHAAETGHDMIAWAPAWMVTRRYRPHNVAFSIRTARRSNGNTEVRIQQDGRTMVLDVDSNGMVIRGLGRFHEPMPLKDILPPSVHKRVMNEDFVEIDTPTPLYERGYTDVYDSKIPKAVAAVGKMHNAEILPVAMEFEQEGSYEAKQTVSAMHLPAGLVSEVKTKGFPRLATRSTKRPELTVGNSFETGGTLTEKFYAFRRVMIDEFTPVKRMQEALEMEVGALGSDTNAISAFRRYFGKIGDRAKRVEEGFKRPVLALLQSAGVTVERAGEHLYALHAEEANDRFLTQWEERQELMRELRELKRRARSAGTNQKIEDELRALDNRIKKDYGHVARRIPKGVDPYEYWHEIVAPSGMRTSEAAEILKRDRAESDAYDTLGEMTREFNRNVRDRMLEDGLITPDQHAQWSSFENYVPLRTSEVDGAQSYPSRGRGFQVRGPETKRRKGRASRADNPLVFSMIQATLYAERGERNNAGNTFLRMLEENAEFVDFITREPELDDQGRPRLAPNEIHLKRNGKDVAIAIENEALRNAVMRSDIARLPVPKLYHTMVQGWRAMVTSLSPLFVATNLVKDVQTAAFNAASLDTEFGMTGIGRGTLKRIVPSMVQLQRLVRDPNSPNVDPEVRAAFDEMRAAGGMIGNISSLTFEQQLEKLESDLALADASGGFAAARRSVRRLSEWVEQTNNAIEVTSRFALYQELRSRGISAEDAALAARQVTTDFSQRGTHGGLLSSLYVFASAGIAGNQRMVSGIVKSKRAQKMVTGMVVLGAVEAMLAEAMSGDDEDGQSLYSKVSEYEKQRNFMFYLPGATEPFKIPRPYGFDLFFTAGRLAYEVATGKKSMKEGGSSLFVAGINNFNPMPGGSVLQTLSPTVTDPLAQSLENKNFMGNPLRPADDPFGPETARHSRSFRGTAPIYSRTAAGINSMFGGNDVRPGAINPAGEDIKNMVSFVTGGWGRIATKSLDAVAAAKSGRPMDDVLELAPLISIFYGAREEFHDQSEFYEATDEIALAKAEMENAKADNDKERLTTLRRKYGRLVQLDKRAKSTQKRVKALKDKAYAQPRQSPERIELLDKARSEYMRFNTAVRKAMEPK